MFKAKNHMVEVAKLENGAHRNQTFCGTLPEDWAIIPDGMEMNNFPFGDVVAQKIGGLLTVTKWTPGIMPDAEPEQPTQLDTIEAQLAYTAMMTGTLLGV